MNAVGCPQSMGKASTSTLLTPVSDHVECIFKDIMETVGHPRLLDDTLNSLVIPSLSPETDNFVISQPLSEAGINCPSSLALPQCEGEEDHSRGHHLSHDGHVFCQSRSPVCSNKVFDLGAMH